MLNLSLKELSLGLERKKFNSVELTQVFLKRIKKFNPLLNAFITFATFPAGAATNPVILCAGVFNSPINFALVSSSDGNLDNSRIFSTVNISLFIIPPIIVSFSFVFEKLANNLVNSTGSLEYAIAVGPSKNSDIADFSDPSRAILINLLFVTFIFAPVSNDLTLNPYFEIDESKILKIVKFTHPYYDQKALDAQSELVNLQNKKDLLFCGSYFGYCFHEDGIKSSIEMLRSLND